MPPARFSMWKKDKAMITQQSMQCILLVTFAVIMSVLLLLLFVVVKPLSICPNPEASLKDVPIMKQPRTSGGSRENIEKFDCMRYPQAAPVVANKVEGVRHPFFISLADLGSPEKPNRNFLRILKGKPFRKPDISQTVQDVLEKLESNGLASKRGTVVDVGANVGMAAFAAAAMGYKVAAFEAVFENLQRLCDGLYLNRAGDMVSFYHAAVSDVPGGSSAHSLRYASSRLPVFHSHCLHFLFFLHFLQRFIVLCPVFIMARRLLSAHALSSLLSDIRIFHARQYTAAAAEAMRSSGAAGREFPEVSKAGRGGGNNKGTVFWMRDPATGNWIPEDHFGETDTAALRQKLLSSRK